MESTILFARQPIFDRGLNVFAYELLCRSGQQQSACPRAQDQASSEVLLNAFSNVEIGNVVGNRRAFINFTEELLHVSPLFGSRYLVVEVLESVVANESALSALKQLRASGFTVALDDFELSADSIPLLAHADIVKLDVLALDERRLAAHVRELRPYGVQLLAEKIETYGALERCQSLGFDYFQGYFLSKPKDFSGRKMAENRAPLMRLLAEIHRPGIEIHDVEKLIQQDPILSLKLLRLINSAAFNLVRQIRSLKEAITMLGIAQIRRWATLLSLYESTDKPLELSAATLVRARMCQLLAERLSPAETDLCFTAGLFSTLDAFLDAPIKDLLSGLSLSQELVASIVEGAGTAGKILTNVIAYEEARWEDLDLSEWIDLTEGDFAVAYTDSLEWVSRSLYGTHSEDTPANHDTQESASNVLRDPA